MDFVVHYSQYGTGKKIPVTVGSKAIGRHDGAVIANYTGVLDTSAASDGNWSSNGDGVFNTGSPYNIVIVEENLLLNLNFLLNLKLVKE